MHAVYEYSTYIAGNYAYWGWVMVHTLNSASGCVCLYRSKLTVYAPHPDTRYSSIIRYKFSDMNILRPQNADWWLSRSGGASRSRMSQPCGRFAPFAELPRFRNLPALKNLSVFRKWISILNMLLLEFLYAQ